MNHTPTIKTSRLVLRPPEPDDAAAIAERINNRRISSMTARVPWPYDLDDARAFVDYAMSSGRAWDRVRHHRPGQGS